MYRKSSSLQSRAHPSFAGMVIISGKSLDLDLEVYANTIRGLCYPQTSLTVDNDEGGLKIINIRMRGNQLKGIYNNYFDISDDKITLFFNDGRYARERGM